MMSLATAEPGSARAEVLARRTQQIDEAVASGRIGPREAEFMKLMQTRGDDPQAHREAVRAWQETNGAALKAERDARRVATQPQRDAARAQALVRRNQQIDQAAVSGRIGPREAEFMKLMHNHSGDPQAHREAVRAWQREHGAALKAERTARRAASKPRRDAARAEAMARRTRQIDESVASGRLGPLEAEFMKLMQNPGNDPQAHRETVRAWQQANGEALKAELKARKSTNQPAN